MRLDVLPLGCTQSVGMTELRIVVCSSSYRGALFVTLVFGGTFGMTVEQLLVCSTFMTSADNRMLISDGSCQFLSE